MATTDTTKTEEKPLLPKTTDDGKSAASSGGAAGEEDWGMVRARLAIAVPWIVMYFGCLVRFYNYQEGRLSNGRVPYLSMLLYNGETDEFSHWSLQARLLLVVVTSIIRV